MKDISWIMNSWFLGLIAICCVFLILSGCTSQQTVAKTGDTVRVYYSVSLPGGTPFESNRNTTPLEFILGAGMVVPGFEDAVLGLSPGQTLTVTVPAHKAYGPYRPELVNTLPTDDVRSSLAELQTNKNLGQMEFPETGPVYIWVKEDGQVGYLRFTNITPETTTIDENHPLAGKDLVFEITLVEIVEKTEQ
jgi:peptidylprolyl isomerase